MGRLQGGFRRLSCPLCFVQPPYMGLTYGEGDACLCVPEMEQHINMSKVMVAAFTFCSRWAAGVAGRERKRERGEQGLHQGCSLDRANKSRPVTCSMAPFEEWGKFGQSEEKGRRSLFSLPKQLTAPRSTGERTDGRPSGRARGTGFALRPWESLWLTSPAQGANVTGLNGSERKQHYLSYKWSCTRVQSGYESSALHPRREGVHVSVRYCARGGCRGLIKCGYARRGIAGV
ncbi:hypothetical protein JOB18_028904 [Solea senegalensis]|uniref:Uncharacterized protein n=1 Tax=Solea senegalensis TaxID=28829 RepID=A0AAV6SFU7_SOLSE|nr:hypothetical protein JOB18_028904 [Solea senegalensis]